MAYTTPTSGSQDATGATEQAKEKVSEGVQQGAEQAKSTIRSQVDQRSTETGSKIKQQASDVRTVAEELRKQGKDAPAKMADQAAEHAERLGGYLHESDADRILSDVEDYARRNPWAVVAGGLAAGFLASRLLKASSDARARRPPSSRGQLTAGNGNDPQGTGRFGGVNEGAPGTAPTY
jgi:ElaB/YqjD/DUF883 family membrane-anchored ribosome-binding protein